MTRPSADPDQIAHGGSPLVAPTESGPRESRTTRVLRESQAALIPAVPITLAVIAAYVVYALAFTHQPLAAGHPTDPPGRLYRLAHWDGSWYNTITDDGYRRVPGVFQRYNFYPLLPYAVRWLHKLIPFTNENSDALLLNVAAICAAMIFVDRSVSEWPRRHRAMLVLLLVTLPGAFFYVTYYGEALFVLWTAITLWALREPERRIWWAAGAVFLACLTRSLGTLLLVPFALVILSHLGSIGRIKGLIAVGLGGLGAVAVPVFFYAMSGDLLAYPHAYREWHNHVTYMGMSETLHTLRTGLLPGPGWSPYATVGLYEVIAAIPLLAIGWFWKRRSFTLYALAALTAGFLNGGIDAQARYVLVLLPIWVGSLAVLRNRSAVWIAVVVVSIAGFAFNLWAFDQFLRWERIT